MTMMTARDGHNHIDDVINKEFGAVRFILPQSQPENENNNNNNTDDSHENHDDDLEQKYETSSKEEMKNRREEIMSSEGKFRQTIYPRDMTRIHRHIFHHSRHATTMPRIFQITTPRTTTATASTGMARRSFLSTNPDIRHRAGAATFVTFTVTPRSDASSCRYF